MKTFFILISMPDRVNGERGKIQSGDKKKRRNNNDMVLGFKIVAIPTMDTLIKSKLA